MAALAWAPAFYRAIDPWLRRRAGILLGVTIGGAWPVTILVAAMLVLSLPAQLAVALVLAIHLVGLPGRRAPAGTAA